MPAAQLALNNRESSATSVSPFFLEHGYYVEPFQLVEDKQPVKASRERDAAEAILQKVQGTTAFVQAALAATQQRYQEAANKRRMPAERFRGWRQGLVAHKLQITSAL